MPAWTPSELELQMLPVPLRQPSATRLEMRASNTIVPRGDPVREIVATEPALPRPCCAPIERNGIVYWYWPVSLQKKFLLPRFNVMRRRLFADPLVDRTSSP